MYTIDELKISILAYFWNVRHWRDRQGTSFTEDMNEATGLPNSEKNMLPAYRAVSGTTLALEVTPVPEGMASSMMKYETAKGELRELSLKPRDQWNEEEREIHAELTHRIKIAAHKLADEGHLDVRPLDDLGAPQPFGADGLTSRFRITHSGLEYARKILTGTKFDKWIRGWDDALAPSEKHKAPEWLQAQWRHKAVEIQ